MCEEFLVERFFLIQRKVKQLDSKLKNVAFLVDSYRDEKKEASKVRNSRAYRSRPASFCISETSIEKRMSLGGYSCQNPKCIEEYFGRENAFEKLREEVQTSEKKLQVA
jgi:hypothetical protein